MGHSYPCSLCSLLLAFSSRFKWSFPFSESLSHSHILYVWNNLQTFHKVRVWGKIDMLAKLLTKLKHFVIFSIRRDKMIPFWKRWCSKQTRELLSITNVIPCIMGSIVWLWESFQFIGFEYQTFSTNSLVGSKMRENTRIKNLWGRGNIYSPFPDGSSMKTYASKGPNVVASFWLLLFSIWQKNLCPAEAHPAWPKLLLLLLPSQGYSLQSKACPKGGCPSEYLDSIYLQSILIIQSSTELANIEPLLLEEI